VRLAQRWACNAVVVRGAKVEDPLLRREAEALSARISRALENGELHDDVRSFVKRMQRKAYKQIEQFCRSLHALQQESPTMVFAVEPGRELSLPLDERGRVPVDDNLRVRGMDSVWAIGDCAAVPDVGGGLSPPTAQHAVRQGPVAARNIAAELGVGTPERFEYRGSAAFVNLGRYKAVGRVGGRKFRGFPAWWMARTYHMSQIPGIARKTRAVIDWTASLPFRRDVAELGSIGHPKALRSQLFSGSGKKYDRGGRAS